MSKFLVTSIATIGVLTAALALAPEAAAEPAEPPCDLALSLLCRLVPTAPDLEGDVDLTNQQPGTDSGLLLPDSAPPVDPCASGCI